MTMWIWIAGYLVVGPSMLMAMTFLPPRMEFMEGTPPWRKALSTTFVILLWPVFLVVMMFSHVERP